MHRIVALYHSYAIINSQALFYEDNHVYLYTPS